MRFSLRHWRPRHLFAAWVTYWIGLLIALVAPAISAGWKVTRPDAHGSVNVGFSDGIINATIIDASNTLWHGSIAFSTFVLWAALPPLALWIVWMLLASRTNNAERERLPESEMRREPLLSEPGTTVTDRISRSTIRRRQEES
jgi:hypothetical protein